MSVRYCRTQRGTLMLVGLLGGAAVCIAAGDRLPLSGHAVAWATAALLAVLAWLFSSLTIEVTEDEIRWHFGPGLWRYRIARASIEAVMVVRNRWRNGFGIRIRPGFRLYNVSGLDAVELRLADGTIRRLGTDDPQGLAAALQT